MAAALVKVLRGGRFGASSQLLLPAIGSLMPQKGVAPLLPHLGSSPFDPRCGHGRMGRLMHTGQWRNSGLRDQKVLPFGRGVLSQQHKLVTMEEFGSKRSYTSGDPIGSGDDLLWGALFIAAGISLAVGIPETVRSLRERSLWTRINKYIKKE